MSENKDWLDEEFPEPEAEEPKAEDKAEAAEPEPKEQPEPEAKGADEKATEEAAPEEEGAPGQRQENHQAIPLAVHLSEREKRQEAERAKQELERKYAELERRQREQEQQREQKPVDPFDDPEGWQAQQRQQAEQRDAEMRLQFSEELMRDKLGDAEFDKMANWWRQQAQANPALVQHGLRQRNPWRYAHEQYQRDNTLSAVGGDIDAFKEQIRQEALAQFKAEQEAQLAGNPDTPKPPPSLAKGGSGGTGDRELTDREVFKEVFGD